MSVCMPLAFYAYSLHTGIYVTHMEFLIGFHFDPKALLVKKK